MDGPQKKIQPRQIGEILLVCGLVWLGWVGWTHWMELRSFWRSLREPSTTQEQRENPPAPRNERLSVPAAQIEPAGPYAKLPSDVAKIPHPAPALRSDASTPSPHTNRELSPAPSAVYPRSSSPARSYPSIESLPKLVGKWRLVNECRSGYCQHPNWSPDGRLLSYEYSVSSRQTLRLMLYNPQNGTSRLAITTAPPLYKAPRGFVEHKLAWNPSPSQRLSQFLYSSNAKENSNQIYNHAGQTIPTDQSLRSAGDLSWSYDGRYIAFTSAHTGNGDLYYARVVGSRLRLRRLTKDPQSTELFPMWSPTNPLSLAYLRQTKQSSRIYLIDNIFVRKSKRLANWLTNVSEIGPSWSPDGSMISFYAVYPDGASDLFVAGTTGNSIPKPIAENVVPNTRRSSTWVPGPQASKLFYIQKIDQDRDAIVLLDLKTQTQWTLQTTMQRHNDLALFVDPKTKQWWLAFTAQSTEKPNQPRGLYIAQLTPVP